MRKICAPTVRLTKISFSMFGFLLRIATQLLRTQTLQTANVASPAINRSRNDSKFCGYRSISDNVRGFCQKRPEDIQKERPQLYEYGLVLPE